MRWHFCRWSAAGLTCWAALIAFLTPVCAAADFYLKIENIPGEIATGGFAGWTRLNGVSADVDRPVPISPLELTRTTLGIRFTKIPGPASPALSSRCASGLIVPKLVLVCLEGGRPSLRLTLNEVKITSFTSSGQAGSLPEDSIGCTFRFMEWSYAQHDGITGGTTASFDAMTQVAAIKLRAPFRAVLDPGLSPAGDLLLTCPVEGGHRYRVMGTPTLTGPWQPLAEFPAATDGVMEVRIPKNGPILFLRVEEVE